MVLDEDINLFEELDEETSFEGMEIKKYTPEQLKNLNLRRYSQN